MKLKELREENLSQNQTIKDLTKENETIESQLVEAKMHWANLDLENDELAYKLNQRTEKLKILSEQITKLELDLVKSK